MRRKPVPREPAFKDALPDLIIGLVGIPVGFSLLEVAGATLRAELWREQRKGLIYFALIILLYGLHSVGLYMIVEVGQRLTNQLPDSQRRVAWQRYLVLRILGSGPVTVFVVATLAAVGVIFKRSVYLNHPMQFEQCVQFLARSLHPGELIPLSFAGVGLVYLIVLTAAPHSRLMDEYPVVLPCYTTAIAVGFVISLLVLFASMH